MTASARLLSASSTASAAETFSLPELMPGTRAYTVVSGRLVEVEVIYVRPSRVGVRRVMLRRADNRKILYQPRNPRALLKAKPGPTVAKTKPKR